MGGALLNRPGQLQQPIQAVSPSGNLFLETFEKCSILVKIKEGENFNHRNILNISRIEI